MPTRFRGALKNARLALLSGCAIEDRRAVVTVALEMSPTRNRGGAVVAIIIGEACLQLAIAHDATKVRFVHVALPPSAAPAEPEQSQVQGVNVPVIIQVVVTKHRRPLEPDGQADITLRVSPQETHPLLHATVPPPEVMHQVRPGRPTPGS